MRNRLIELLDEFRLDCIGNCSRRIEGTNECHKCAYSKITDYLLANGVIVLPYNLQLPKELYCHMFDEDKNKVVVKCKVGKNTGYGFTLIHYRDGREWEYKYTSIGKTVFLTKEEAEKALKGGAE